MSKAVSAIIDHLANESVLFLCGERDSTQPAYSAAKLFSTRETSGSNDQTFFLQTNRFDTFQDFAGSSAYPRSIICFASFEQIPLPFAAEACKDFSNQLTAASRINVSELPYYSKTPEEVGAAAPNFIVFDIPKERAVLNQWLALAQQIADTLGIDITLLIAGEKAGGIKSLVKRIKSESYRFLRVTHLDKQKVGSHDLLAISITQNEPGDLHLVEKQFEAFRTLNEVSVHIPAADETHDSLSFLTFTKAGVYGDGKVDEGSKELIDVLYHFGPDLIDHVQHSQTCPSSKSKEEEKPIQFLDLGCGSGILGSAAVQLFRLFDPDSPIQLTATDNNAEALLASYATLALLQDAQTNIEVVASDAGEDMCQGSSKVKYDLIVCNPPFHQGFTSSHQLHERFLSHAVTALAKNGVLFLVVNRFLAIEEKLKRHKLSYRALAQSNRFKVLRCQRM